MTAAQVNLLLGIGLAGVFVTGLTSWAVGTGWSRWWTAAHAVLGFMVLILAPAKTRRSVRPGLRRRRPGRWLSVAFGLLVVAAIALGVVNATGLWTGVGYWSPLWTHFLVAFAIVPLFGWHLFTRPVPARTVNLDRRFFLGGATAAGVAAVLVVGVEAGVRLAGVAGRSRRFTGSHEVGSHDPDALPVVSWINDRAPTTPAEAWSLTVDGRPVELAALASATGPLDAVLDCTGGWWSEQTWAVVPLGDLIGPGGGAGARSFEVVSATGYRRAFPMSDAPAVYLAVGYEGRDLRRGHGGPVRVVAPGRRGPWWVKWVVAVESSDRPWYLQLPFPAT